MSLLGSDAPRLDAYELDRLLSMLETGALVRRRHQFYLWAQGLLQSFLPHETLLCSLGNELSPPLYTDVCSRAVLSEETLRDFCSGENSLLLMLTAEWTRIGRVPMRCRAIGSDTPIALRMQALNVAQVAFHGMPGLRKSGDRQIQAAGSFFAFLQPEEENWPRLRYMLDLLLPQLHAALLHVCSADPAAGSASLSEPSLSEREQQVLDWVRKGKTNYEIGTILDISPLTVKNHVQNILRKLNVSNRAQAVASAFRFEARS